MGDLDDIMAASDAARVKELEDKITKARDAYYNSTPDVSDEIYDAWVDELSELRGSSPAVTAIGAKPVSEWAKVKHDIPMGSLNKVNTLEELTTWIKSFAPTTLAFEQLLVTEKLDGISICVKYQKGLFEQAITRGDGTIGEDISNNVCRMQGVPAKLPEKFTGSLRGEVVLTKTNHAKHFPDYANTRNAASGIAKRYDGKGCEHLTILFYTVAEGKEFEVESQQFEWLEAQGFKTPSWYVTAMAPGVKTPHDLWIEYQQTKRSALEYDIDGLVVRLQNLVKQVSLGDKDGRPLGAVAFKFAPITRETPGKDVLWQVGGTGIVAPVAVLEPVHLLGTEITRASLYNIKYMREIGYAPGCRVLIARANDVIPRVVSVTIPSPNPLVIPTQCPSCSMPLSMDGEYLVCTNSAACPAQTVGRIERYVKGLGILEWGETLIAKLVENGLVKRASDLYRLKNDDIAGIERMGDKSAENVLKTLWARNPIPMEDLLGSLSIPGCATSTIRTVMDAGYETWDKFQKATAKDFEKVPGMGPEKSKALSHWLETQGRHIMAQMLEVGVKIKERKVGVLTGLSFCFTGKSVMKRGDLEALVADNGGNVKGSVSKGLSYLVMADATSNSTKAQAARKNGTKVLSEEDFLKMVRP
jgi:DNA ligase (NAD+)